VRATFSADINPLTITTSSFYIQEPGGAPLPAAVSYSATTKTATLKTLADLLPGHSYVVTLTSALLATDASALAPHTWSFITVASPAPAVTNLIPVAGAQNQALGQVISVSFSGEMDPATLTSSSFYIAKVKGNPLPAIIKYYGGVGSGIATLTPSGPLDPGSTYQVTLTAVVRGANGRTLSGAPITWSFSTVAGQPPQITSTVPVSGALDRPVDQMISVSFDKDMNPATLTAASFYIAPAAGGSPLASTIAYSAATKTATLAPVAALAHDTTYQVTLTSVVMSTSGLSVLGAPIVWTFKTAKAPIVFTDVPAGYRYAAAIYQMAARGVLSGFADGTFRPDDSVIRQEFAKMIVRTLGYPVSLNDVCPFTDVATSTPGHPVDPTDPFFPDHYIAVAAAHGVTQGFTPTTFLPYASISRYQVITMVVRALDNLHLRPATNPPGIPAIVRTMGRTRGVQNSTVSWRESRLRRSIPLPSCHGGRLRRSCRTWFN
jgi:hypothetical protein